ncbi:MAG TPA: hypothetical protein VNF00_02520 [Candidatus Acidoferrales bacterium]|nr:hypothetical protein [Candidatus Acidoferrales bacterium]
MSAQQLVREVVRNEVNAGKTDHSLWRFRKITIKDGKRELHDVIETKQGEVDRLLEVNGKPLTPAQRQAADAKIQKLLTDPDAQKKQEKAQNDDSDKETKLLQMLPDALLFQYAGRRGNVVKLTFKPNPKFHASTREAEVFHHMSGVMLVDARAKRLVEMSGTLTSEVKFGDGILGHLDKGGTFVVKQAVVARGHWDMTLLDTELTGKALFFKTISVREKEIESNYRRVAANITLQQAAQTLKRDKTEVAAITRKKASAK